MIEDAACRMPEDEEKAISVEAGQTKELRLTFDEAGETLAGCHSLVTKSPA